jgi:hypothetical protein
MACSGTASAINNHHIQMLMDYLKKPRINGKGKE